MQNASKGGRSPFSRSENADRREAAETAAPQKERRIGTTEAIDIYRDILKENIEYDALCRNNPRRVKEYAEILELMLDTVCSERKTVRIGGEDKPAEVVKSRFLKLDGNHLCYVMECLDKNTTDIRNMKSYLLTALYNAPLTMENHYKSQVSHDLHGC